MQHYIVVGSSRGLGAALVDELLGQGAAQVIGVARTKLAEIPQAQPWLDSGRYRHVEVDLGSAQASQALKAVCAELLPSPVCVILNAAAIHQDVHDNGSLDYEIVKQINRVNVDGMVQVIEAFETHLLTYHGAVVGISSVWGTTPPVAFPWVAYPTSKAYLNMFLRCLRAAWRDKVRVLTVHLGVTGRKGTSLMSRLAVPTYQMTARKIVRCLAQGPRCATLRYPFGQTVIYRILGLVPDALLFWIFSMYAKR